MFENVRNTNSNYELYNFENGIINPKEREGFNKLFYIETIPLTGNTGLEICLPNMFDTNYFDFDVKLPLPSITIPYFLNNSSYDRHKSKTKNDRSDVEYEFFCEKKDYTDKYALGKYLYELYEVLKEIGLPSYSIN